MTEDERLADLLLRWEELQEQGREANPEELCRDCPELAGPLTRRIEALKALQWMKEPVGNEPATPNAAATQDEQALHRILAGRYRLDRLVGEGGFGQVWQGFDLELERPVAVKVPKPSRRFSEAEIERFVAEARKVAQLRHAGIVAVHDIHRSGGAYFFVSDWIEGSDLASRMRQGRFPQDQAARIVAEVARILAYAHGQGIVHRDIKPANILLDSSGHPLVTDFGIAANEQELLHEQRGVPATLAYASPEQASGQTIDARSDLWSLGVVLYELLAGRLPFDDPSPVVLKDKILSHQPPPLRPLDPTISKTLERICLKCLAKRPDQRYASAQELANDLNAYLQTPQPKNRKLLAFGAVLLLTGLVSLTLFWPRLRSPSNQQAQDQEGRTDEQVRTIQASRCFRGHSGPVLSLAFRPDGKLVTSGSADETVRLWRVDEDNDDSMVLQQVTGVSSLTFTSDGKTLACGCENGTIRLWDLTGAKPKEGLVLPGHAGPITCVAFSPDGRFLVTGGKDGSVRLFNRGDPMPTAAVIPKAGGVVLWISFSPGGDKLLVGYGDSKGKSGEFYLWEMTTKDGKPQLALRQRAPLAGLTGLKAVLISPDDKLILAAAGSEVYVWNKEGGKDSFRVTGSFARPATCLALSPDKKAVLSSGKDGLFLWSVKEMKATARLAGHDGPVNCLVFSPVGQWAASGGTDGTVRFWPTEE